MHSHSQDKCCTRSTVYKLLQRDSESISLHCCATKQRSNTFFPLSEATTTFFTIHDWHTQLIKRTKPSGMEQCFGTCRRRKVCKHASSQTNHPCRVSHHPCSTSRQSCRRRHRVGLRRSVACAARDLDIQVFRFTLGIPGFDDAYISRVVGFLGLALLAVAHGASSSLSDAQVFILPLVWFRSAFIQPVHYKEIDGVQQP